MPKWDWGAFLGNAADTGIEAYRTAAAASTAKGELDRRNRLDAFNMGLETPVIERGPAGGIGGVARNEIDAQAGLPPEQPDYSQYDTPGAIGAAPAVSTGASAPQGGMGDRQSRQAVGGATAQANEQGPPPSGQRTSAHDEAIRVVSDLDEKDRQYVIQGVKMADEKRKQATVKAWIADLNKPLANLRNIETGARAAQALIDKRDVQMNMFKQAQDALYLQMRDTAEGPEKDKIVAKINSLKDQIDGYSGQIEKAYKIIENAPTSAAVAAEEARRYGDALVSIGVDQADIDHYRRTFMRNGYISDVENMIIGRIGRNTPMKRPGKVGPSSGSLGAPARR